LERLWSKKEHQHVDRSLLVKARKVVRVNLDLVVFRVPLASRALLDERVLRENGGLGGIMETMVD